MKKVRNFQAITFTTFSYKDYTKNLLSSIDQNNVNLDLKVYVLDRDSEEYFKKIHNNTVFLDSDENFSEFMDQKDSRFGELMIKKFDCIHRSLLENKNVLYIDGDIVIKKDIKQYLLNNMKNLDILFQNDKNPKKPNQENLCAGFMLIKSNKKTIKFFDPKKIPIKKITKYRTHDQTYIIRNRAKFKYKVLPQKDFPNGPFFYENFKSIDPAIIHFNFVLGERKIELMKEYGEWYLK